MNLNVVPLMHRYSNVGKKKKHTGSIITRRCEAKNADGKFKTQFFVRVGWQNI